MSDPYSYKPIEDSPGSLAAGQVPPVPASRGSRFWAVLIDNAILFLGAFAILIPLVITAVLSRTSLAEWGLDEMAIQMFTIGATIPGIAVVLVINLVFLAKTGQTIGKRLMKIQINRRGTGEKAGLSRIVFLRYSLEYLIAAAISTAITLLASESWDTIGNLYILVSCLMIFRSDRRCLHDLIADTEVVWAPDAPGWKVHPALKPLASSKSP